MSKYIEKTTREVIKSNKNAIKSNRPKVALKDNPNLLNEEQKKAEAEIEKILIEMKSQHNELMPFVKRLKDYVSDITEETHFCAIYLLLCQAMAYWESIFLLAKNGNSSAIQLILRTIKESLVLAELFSFEFANKENNHLKKWFSGEIVLHSVFREKIKEIFNNSSEEENIYLENILKDLYRMESHSIHAAYTSIIESVSPFTEDFDFEKYTRFRRTSYNLNYVKGAMDGTVIALKFVYKFLLKDLDSYNKLDKILLRYTKNSSM